MSIEYPFGGCVEIVGTMYRVHSLALRVHNLTPQKRLNDLYHSFDVGGVRQPITARRVVQEDGQEAVEVVDGVARLRWFAQKGIDPMPYLQIVDLPTEDDVAAFIAATNLRRELTTEQRVVLAHDDLAAARERAKQRMEAGVLVAEGIERGSATESVAKQWGTNRKYVEWFEKFPRELREKVREGTTTINAAHREYEASVGRETIKRGRAAAKRSGQKEGPSGTNSSGFPAEDFPVDTARQHQDAGELTWSQLLTTDIDDHTGTMKVAALAARLWRDREDAQKVQHWAAEIGAVLEALTGSKLEAEIDWSAIIEAA